jgi:predicted ATPase
MLKKFRVQNFMCLKDVTVELCPLTIFIGPNSSGKSAFFKALTTFCRLLYYPVRGGTFGDFNVEPGVGLDEIVWGGDTALPIIFEAWLDDPKTDQPDYSMELHRGYPGWSIVKERFLVNNKWLDTSLEPFEFKTTKEPKSWPGPYKATLFYLTEKFSKDRIAEPILKPIQDLRIRLGTARRYRPSASDIAASVKPSSMPLKGRRVAYEVNEAGHGLALALQEVWKSDRATFDAIQKQLQEIHDHILTIDFIEDWRGVGLVYGSNRTRGKTAASLESDGVLLTTFLLWRLHTAYNNFKLCIEEPENGVHIAAMKIRYKLLKQFAAVEGSEQKMQILIATHSRDFLNAIGHRTDIVNEVRVTEFSSTSGTAIYPLKHYRDIDQLLNECKDQMGDLWWSGRMRHE